MTRAAFVISTVALVALARSAAAADLPVKAPPPPAILAAYDWNGFYAGGHIGYAWGASEWSTPGNTGALNLSQPVDVFAETGSFFEGLHAGFNYTLPNRIVVGVEADTTFPAFRNLNGLSIGAIHGTIGLDLPEWNADTDPIPYPDGSIAVIHAYHFLEHLKDPVKMLADCQRVLRPGGLMNIVVPYYTSQMMAHDLTHKHAFARTPGRLLFAIPITDKPDRRRSGSWRKD